MLERKESVKQTGFFVVRRDTYEVLCLDDGMKRLFPKLEVGAPCYTGLGERKPCQDCPLHGLDGAHKLSAYRESLGMEMACFRLDGENPSALVTYGVVGLDERQKWMDHGRYQAILQQNRTIAFEFDPQTGEQFVSPFISQFLCGRYDSRLLSQIMLEDGVLHPQDKEKMIAFRDKMPSLQGSDSIFMRLKTKKDGFRWHRMLVCAYHDDRLDHTVLMGTITDTDEEVRLRERQRRLAEYDESTGLFHKTAFFQAAEHCRRNNQDRTYSMVVFDIDRFKLVNDLFGVQEGDSLLRFLSRRIQDVVQPGETCGRIRDDMFGMFLARSDQEILDALESLSQSFYDYPLAYRISLSAGICRVFLQEDTPTNILCDRAMLALKTVKSNAVRWTAFYEEQLGTAVRREQELIDDMHRGIEKGEFEAWFQPKNDLKSGEIVGAEALVRWRHPQKGLLLPAAFLPVLERNGLIAPLDEYVWEETARILRQWQDEGLNPPPVSINVSRIHLYDPQLAEKLCQLLKRYELPPHMLEIELTESAYVENPNLSGLMKQLKTEGFTFLMDDFGSGYSSLNMLRNIPVDILKLDLHFLSGGGEASNIIMESVIQMARRLQIPVIAEGVEQEEQAVFLREAGCGIGQGYLYAKPMPAADFARRLENRSH